MSGKAKGGAPKAPPPQTDLQAQLRQLAVTQGVDQGRRHLGKASLLYTLQEAADIDAETIQRIGLEGEEPMAACPAPRGCRCAAGARPVHRTPQMSHPRSPRTPPSQAWTSCARWTAASMPTAARCLRPRQRAATGMPTRPS